MKSFASFYPQRQHPIAAPGRAAATCTLRMTVDAASITALRQLAMRICGEALEFMRIAMCAGGTRIQVWLCVRLSCADVLSAAIASQLPGALFAAEAGHVGVAA